MRELKKGTKMKVQNISTKGQNFITPERKPKESRYIPVGTTQEPNDSFQPAFSGNGNSLPKLKGFTLAGLLGLATFAPITSIAQQANKINPNAVIYKVDDDELDLELEPKLINPKDEKYKKHVAEFDSIYNRKDFLKTWDALPSSSKLVYEDVENQLATRFIKDEKIPSADSVGVENIKKGLYEIPNKKKNPVVLSVLESTNEAIKNNSPENPVKEIFNPKLLSPRKYKLFVDINYAIKDHLVFNSKNRLTRSDLPYASENVKKAQKEFKALYKEADFIDYIYKVSYRNLINRLIHR